MRTSRSFHGRNFFVLRLAVLPIDASRGTHPTIARSRVAGARPCNSSTIFDETPLSRIHDRERSREEKREQGVENMQRVGELVSRQIDVSVSRIRSLGSRKRVTKREGGRLLTFWPGSKFLVVLRFWSNWSYPGHRYANTVSKCQIVVPIPWKSPISRKRCFTPRNCLLSNKMRWISMFVHAISRLVVV